MVSGQRPKESICQGQMVLNGNAALGAANLPPAWRLVPSYGISDLAIR